jgi:hypothetical protein
MRDASRTRAQLIGYAALAVLLALIISKHLGDLLPRVAAHHVGSDSEGYALALLLVPWIAWVRPRLLGRQAALPVALLAGAGSGAVGVWLYGSHVLGTVKTLNETFLALALLFPYVTLRRPLARPTGAVCSLVVLVVTVLLEQTGAHQVVTNVAEGVVMLLVVPLALDVFDRAALDPEQPVSWRARLGCWAALLVVPAVSILLRHVSLGRDAHLVVDFAARAQEAFVGTLLVLLYLAIQRPAARAPLPQAGAPEVAGATHP